METQSDQKNAAALEEEQQKSSSNPQSYPDLMNIEYLNHQEQTVVAITEADRVLVNKILYFMAKAFNRVMEALQYYQNVIHSNGDLDFESMRSHLLLDNAYVQFQSLSMKFPEKCRNIFEETLDKMKNESQNFYSFLSDQEKEILDPHLKRLAALLRFEKTESPSYPKVESMDPEKILPIFAGIQQTYAEQDRDLKRINEGTTDIQIPDFNSTIIFDFR